MTSARQIPDYTREPNIGWDNRLDQILYTPISDTCEFRFIVVNVSVIKDMFEIIFQKPKNPHKLNSILSHLDCKIDETQKLLNNFSITIHRLKVNGILSVIQQAGFLSDFLAKDIGISIKDFQVSPEDSRENQAEEKQQKEREIILTENSFWIEKDKLQTQKLQSLIEELLEDPRKKQSLEKFVTLSLDEKKRLLFFLMIKHTRFDRFLSSTTDLQTHQWEVSQIGKFKQIYQLICNMDVTDNHGLGEAIQESERKINTRSVFQDALKSTRVVL